MIRFSNAFSKDDVVKIGLNIILKLFNAKHEKSLNKLRPKKYLEKVSGLSKNAIKPEILDPTQNAAELNLFSVTIKFKFGKKKVQLILCYGDGRNNGKIMPIEMAIRLLPRIAQVDKIQVQD